MSPALFTLHFLTVYIEDNLFCEVQSCFPFPVLGLLPKDTGFLFLFF